MTFTAGQKISTADLDTIGSVSFQFIGAAANTHQAVTAGAADIAGTSLTFTTQYANTRVAIWAVYDPDSTGVTSVFVGTCLVDGATQSGEAHSSTLRVTCAMMWIATLAAAGSHTIKLQSAKSGGTDTINTNQVHTKWHALVFGP